MAEEAPANKAAGTPQNKTTPPTRTQAKTAAKAPAQKVYHLTTPDGRKYNTPDKAEAEHLTRTRGYKLTK